MKSHALHILLLLLLLRRLASISAVTTDSADAPAAHQYTSCSDKLVTFSTCLPYVALAPNNVTGSPSPQCCDEVSAAFGDGSSVCLCYFVRRPGIFGFPLNYSKVMSLASACPVKNRPAPNANFSLETICSRPAALPPLQSISGPRNPTLPNLGAENSLPLPPLEPSGSSSIEEPNEGSPSQPSPSSTVSSTTQGMYRLRFSWTWLCFPVYILASS